MLTINKIKCARCGEYKSARSYDMSGKLAICNKCFDKKPYITADELTFDNDMLQYIYGNTKKQKRVKTKKLGKVAR